MSKIHFSFSNRFPKRKKTFANYAYVLQRVIPSYLSCLVANPRIFTEVLTERRLMNELKVLFFPFSNYSRT